MGSCPHTNEVNPRHVQATKVPYLTHRTKNEMAVASLLPFTSLTEMWRVALGTHQRGDSGKRSSARARKLFTKPPQQVKESCTTKHQKRARLDLSTNCTWKCLAMTCKHCKKHLSSSQLLKAELLHTVNGVVHCTIPERPIHMGYDVPGAPWSWALRKKQPYPPRKPTAGVQGEHILE